MFFSKEKFKNRLEKGFQKVYEENEDVFMRADKRILYLSYLAGRRDEGAISSRRFLILAIIFLVSAIFQSIPYLTKWLK